MKIYFILLYAFVLTSGILIQTGCENQDSPTCIITSIDNNEQIPHGTKVLIALEASDADGRITLVDFYIDGEKIEKNNYFPYQYVWNTLEEQTGSHTIRASATDDSDHTTSHEISVSIDEGVPTSAFAAYPPSVSLGSSTQFFNESINNPKSWLWDFGDGNTSESENPTHTYGTEGVYTVSLTVTNSFGTDTQTKTDYFTITTPLIDYDGNIYPTVQIGNQLWMQENLKVTHYADGTTLTDGTGVGNVVDDYSSKYHFAYSDDEGNVGTYGRLYSWAAAMGDQTSSDTNPSGVRGVCPAGWHVPSDDEWKELEIYLGMKLWDANRTSLRGDQEGVKLKESSLNYWSESFRSLYPVSGTNESGFTALPAGANRGDVVSSFKDVNDFAYFWSATESDNSYAWSRRLHYKIAGVYRFDDYKHGAYSVRCIKD